MTSDPFDALLNRIEQSGVAARSSLVGCSPAEIAGLEARYGLRLPQAYRRYLELMGHELGKLFASDHAAVSYSYVLKMTAKQREEEADHSRLVRLPDGALIIMGRLDDQFEFICCSALDDSPVWYFNTWDWAVKEVYSSVIDWLEAWCSEAEEAMASGYFEIYPDGTTP